MDYNYERYKMSNYDLTRFDGPAAGEELIDFKLTKLVRKSCLSSKKP